MKQTVVLKSNASGITLVLDENVSFDQLVEDTIQVFYDNDEFFQKSRFAIAFKGRNLTEDEEIRMVMAINERTNANIIRIISEDTVLDNQFKQQQDEFDRIVLANTGKFHKGNLKSKDVLEMESSVVILGDVQDGARVISKGNIIVLGALRGSVHAGAGGNDEAFVAALIMEPSKLRISDLTYFQEKKRGIFAKKSSKNKQPQIATVQRGRIEVGPIISE